PRDDGLDGPDSLRAGSGCPLRRRAADGGGGVLAVATNHHPLAGTRLAPQPGSGPRLEGQALAPLLSARHRAVRPLAGRIARCLRPGGARLAGAGPAHRARVELRDAIALRYHTEAHHRAVCGRFVSGGSSRTRLSGWVGPHSCSSDVSWLTAPQRKRARRRTASRHGESRRVAEAYGG